MKSIYALLVPALLAAAPARADVWHIVSFRFKHGADAPAAVAAFEALKDSATDAQGRKLITFFKDGVNNSTEQLSFGAKGVAADRGDERTFLLSFATVEDRDYYVASEPHHQAFKTLVGPLLENGAESVFVTDFAAQ